MVKLTAWTKFLTDYHKKSGNAKLSKSMKEASPLYKKHNGKHGKTGKHGRKRGGAEVVPAEVVPADSVVPAEVVPADSVAQPATEVVQPATGGGDDEQPVAPVVQPVAAGGRSRKRKGSKKSKTRRR